MHKENGMYKPADKKEVANKRTAILKCEKCGHTEKYKKVFGEHLKCKNCGELFYPTNP